MSRCVVEPGLEFESSLFARELLEDLRVSVPARRQRVPATRVRTVKIELTPPTVVEIPEIVDEIYERWDGLG